MDSYKGASIGVIVHCEDGYLSIPNYSEAVVHDKEGNKVQEFKGAADHFANFITAVRSRKPTDLNADIEQGHLSSALCHTGNISYRLGSAQPFSAKAKAFGDDKDAFDSYSRMQ